MDKLARRLELDPVEPACGTRSHTATASPPVSASRAPPGCGGDPPRRRAACSRAGSSSARPDPPTRRRGEHDSRRGRATRRRLRCGLQEHRLLRRLRRLLRCARPPVRGRSSRSALRRGRGRAGRDERDPPGCSDELGTADVVLAPLTTASVVRGLRVCFTHDLDGRRRRPARAAPRSRSRRETEAAKSTSSGSTGTTRRARSTRRRARRRVSARTLPSLARPCASSPKWTSSSG